jgi:hypothetical protein
MDRARLDGSGSVRRETAAGAPAETGSKPAAVLIGRPRDVENLDALDAAREREHVRMVTYDEILDRQRALL